MNDITAVILTKNEEIHLPDCLAGLSWCDEVLVFDSLSTDRTLEISRQAGAHILQRAFTNFADQRNAALETVTTAWVLFVDADERVPVELAQEILAAIHDTKYNAYAIPRHNYQLSRLILHAGLYPDYQVRLLKKGKASYDPDQIVHERVILEGAAGYLTHHFIHYLCDSWGEYKQQQKLYAQMKAKIYFAQGVKPSYHFFTGPILEFLRRYIYLQGFRDGWHGLYLSWIYAYYYFIAYVNLAKLWTNSTRTPEA
jgi:hypothetical protein